MKKWMMNIPQWHSIMDIKNHLPIIYPLVICYIAIENGPVEIVDLPIENGGSFHSYGKSPF